MTGPVTAAEVETFRTALEAMLREHHTKAGNVGDPPRVTIMDGSRYCRIVTEDAGSRSAYGFIDRMNGDLLKSSGWKAPAKHARGNLRGEKPLAGCGPYGMAYLA
jgi:hypothetical protein